MRILYLDLDSTRPDHLGCYGYHRPTSPNVDHIASRAIRLGQCYASDAPCLPSRTALYSGRHGHHTGVINHGGHRSQPYPDGVNRSFMDVFRATSWPAALRACGHHTAAISPFGERHSAWHWYAGINEIINTGGCGMEPADIITPVVTDWVSRNARRENWFLHVNLWDAHIPYRTPAHYNPFKDDPLPAWPHEGIRARDWLRPGQHSPQELIGWDDKPTWCRADNYPLQPLQLRDMADVRRQLDLYDAGIRYSDDHVGRILNQLADTGVLDDTAIIVSADHGENFGEMGVWGDHQTADAATCRVPCIFHWPGVTDRLAGQQADGLAYHFDFAATAIDLAGGKVPENWHGRSFAPALRSAQPASLGRNQLVLSQFAHVGQRSARWGDYLYIRTYHDGLHDFPRELVYNLAHDPYEEHDLASTRPDLVAEGARRLDAWEADMRRLNPLNEDPKDTVLAEGGPFHAKGQLSTYLKRLRATGRSAAADLLQSRHAPTLSLSS